MLLVIIAPLLGLSTVEASKDDLINVLALVTVRLFLLA